MDAVSKMKGKYRHWGDVSPSIHYYLFNRARHILQHMWFIWSLFPSIDYIDYLIWSSGHLVANFFRNHFSALNDGVIPPKRTPVGMKSDDTETTWWLAAFYDWSFHVLNIRLRRRKWLVGQCQPSAMTWSRKNINNESGSTNRGNSSLFVSSGLLRNVLETRTLRRSALERTWEIRRGKDDCPMRDQKLTDRSQLEQEKI